jgi:hypothetical protein
VSDIPMKTVRVRATVEYDLQVPESMSKEDIEFHRNEGTWCGDSLVEELQGQVHSAEGEEYRPCLCGVVRYEVLDQPEWRRIRDARLYMPFSVTVTGSW